MTCATQLRHPYHPEPLSEPDYFCETRCPDVVASDAETAKLLCCQAAALDHMLQGLCMYDSRQRIVLCNKRFAEMYGLSQEQVKPGTTLEEVCRHRIARGVFGEGDPDDYIAERMASVNATADKTQELNDGRTILIRRRPMKNGGWVTTHEDITDRRIAEARVEHLATHDMLTGLPNRTLFGARLDTALKRVQRGEKAGILWLDIDEFKSVNDTLGHGTGDRLLCEFATRLQSALRETDTVARLSGDEFAVYQSQINEAADCSALSQRLIEVLSEPYSIDGHLIMIGVSIGIAIADADNADAGKLLRAADLALYRAKNDGRGTFRFFNAEMDALMQRRRETETDLRAALVREELELFYQPIIELGRMKVVGFEALVRWRHPERGMVPPNDFISIAEETGLILPIGEWVLRNACLEAAGWREPHRVSINFSAVQFRHGNPAESVANALRLSGLEPSRFEVEVTESLLLDNSPSMLAKLRELKALGVRISMDDFGTGYSSLNYLNAFPFDKIKIDRSFVKDLPGAAGSLAILRAISGLGESLGMSTTVEGVETDEQLNIAISERCTEVQGYYFSPPKPASELPRVLHECELKARELERRIE